MNLGPMVKETVEAKLLAHVKKFIKEQQITCSETVYQSDRVIENGYDFIDGCAKIVGFHRDED
jgi:hypothetical protein